MSFWATPIAATRYDADSLWLPSLSLDLIGRDLSMVKVPLEFQMPITSQVGAGTSDVPIIVCYPESWSLDQSFNPMVARLTFVVNVSAFVVISTLEIVGGTIVTLGATGFTTITKDYTGTLPVGAVIEIIRMVKTGNGTFTAGRALGTDGPRNSIEVLNTGPIATSAAGARSVARRTPNDPQLFYDLPPGGIGATSTEWRIGEHVQVLTSTRHQVWRMTPNGWQLEFQVTL